MEANIWRKWAEKFLNSKTRRISRLVRELTLTIIFPLRFQILCLAIMKKSDGKDWRRTNIGNLKYEIRVPRKAKESAQFDK